MVFDTKVAILVLDDLAVWQKLNVTAFLASGIAGAAPEAMGEPYEDAADRRFAPLLGQPMLVFAATPRVAARPPQRHRARPDLCGLCPRHVRHRPRCGEPRGVQGRTGGCARPGRHRVARAEEGCGQGDKARIAAPVTTA